VWFLDQKLLTQLQIICIFRSKWIQYIKSTPIIGGAEGWLQTPGFCVPGSKGNLKKQFFMLKDSHVLMFNGGDELKKPRGAMYLVGTSCREMEVHNDNNCQSLFIGNIP
jgi:hypothetical protein